EPPSAEELQGVQNYMAGTFTLSAASRFGILSQIRMLDLHGLPESYLRNYVQNVYAVTPADVQRIARQYLSTDRMLITIVGDRSQILEQIQPFGEVITDGWNGRRRRLSGAGPSQPLGGVSAGARGRRRRCGRLTPLTPFFRRVKRRSHRGVHRSTPAPG